MQSFPTPSKRKTFLSYCLYKSTYMYVWYVLNYYLLHYIHIFTAPHTVPSYGCASWLGNPKIPVLTTTKFQHLNHCNGFSWHESKHQTSETSAVFVLLKKKATIITYATLKLQSIHCMFFMSRCRNRIQTFAMVLWCEDSVNSIFILNHVPNHASSLWLFKIWRWTLKLVRFATVSMKLNVSF